jgi:REP element-mobilizing transposase RayT
MKWKNIARDTNTFFITATINGWQPLFNHQIPRNILFEDLAFYRRKYDGKIHAYVVMPEHYHIALSLDEPSVLHSWLRDIHSHSSNEISKWLRDKETLKDYAMGTMLSHFMQKAEAKSKLTIWKEQARAEGILSAEVLRQKIDYIHANPVRRGLVVNPGDWPWSSWKAFYHDEQGVLAVDKIDVF